MLKKLFMVFPVLLCVTVACCLVTHGQQHKKKARSKPIKRVVVEGKLYDRSAIEANLLSGKFDHDEIGELAHIGTMESVPGLLRVLDHFKVRPNGAMICTRAHALSALYRITGQDLGPDYQPWADWWDANKPSRDQK